MSIFLKSIGQFAKINSLIFLFAKAVLAQDLAPAIPELVTNYFTHLKDDFAAKGYRSEIKPGNYGPLLAARECTIDPELELTSNPFTQQRNTVAVSCQDKASWKLFLNIDISLYDYVVVTNKAIARNHVITEQDLAIQEQEINRSRYPYFTDISQVSGLVAKQTLRAETTLNPRQLIHPALVKKGDRVIIHAHNDAISVKMDGIALSEGRLGEQIDVKNARSERVVRGLVTDRGVISVTL